MENKLKFDWENYKTDKNMTGHGYNDCYDDVFETRRFLCKNVIEIGTRPGSINLWNDYFPNSTLYGLDILDPKVKSDRFVYEHVNQGSEEDWQTFKNKYDFTFDVIIDDGPHTTPEQLICFNTVFEKLSSGGIFVIEDLHATEPYDNTYLRNKKYCNFSILDVLKNFQNNIYTPIELLPNMSYIQSNIDSVVIKKSKRNRWYNEWPHYTKESSEIAFIFKK